ncbi:MAG: DUF3124 domain-containing protein [Desulfobacterales bacterium]|nr:DUF3124 domain-containing protein [Desulfobacterales bacterium]
MNHHDRSGFRRCAWVVLAVVFFFHSSAFGESGGGKGLSTGETIYVPVYSHIYSGPRSMPLQLNAILCFQNTDSKYGVQLIQADYYDSDGKMVESYISKPLNVKPLASKSLHLKKYKRGGGVGEKFILKWRSREPVNHPVVESVMIGVRSGQGISFRCPGKIVVDR